jgi:GTPase SAR1 family protein
MEESQFMTDVRRLSREQGPLSAPEARPIHIVVSGLSGTGKTCFSRRLVGLPGNETDHRKNTP